MNSDAEPSSPATALTTQGDLPASKAEKSKRPKLFHRPLPVIILGVLFVLATVFSTRLLLHALATEATDDAFIDGHIVNVAPQVSGRVLRVKVQDNQRVAAGDPLFALDPRDLAAVVAQQQAALAQAQAKLASNRASAAQARAHVETVAKGGASALATVRSAQATAEKNQQDYDRFRKLQQRGAVSQQDYQHASTDLSTAQADVESKQNQAEAAQAYLQEAQAASASSVTQVTASEADVQRAEASLAQAKLQLSYAEVVAPVAGTVTRKAVEAGSYVQAGQGALALVPAELFVTANFKETQLRQMRAGQPVEVEIDAYPHHPRHGRVDSFQTGSGARFSLLPPENATGNFVKVVQRVPVKIVFDRTPPAQEALGPGMSVVPTVEVRPIRAAGLIVAVAAGLAALIAFFVGARLIASGRARPSA